MIIENAETQRGPPLKTRVKRGTGRATRRPVEVTHDRIGRSGRFMANYRSPSTDGGGGPAAFSIMRLNENSHCANGQRERGLRDFSDGAHPR